MFQRNQDFPFGQRLPHSTFPTHHHLWDTTLVQAWRGPWGCRSLRFIGFLDTRHMKVARLSDLCSCRFCPQEIFLVLISVRGWADPRAVERLERLSREKIPMNPSGNRTSDLAAFSAVPHPAAPQHVPYCMGSLDIFTVHRDNSSLGDLGTLCIFTCLPAH